MHIIQLPVLFIPATVAEGGALSQGLFMAVILRSKYPVKSLHYEKQLETTLEAIVVT